MKQDWSQECHADWCHGLGWLALIVLLLSMPIGHAWAQQSVLPGYQVCSSASGSTQCSFQPISVANPLPVTSSGGGVSVPGFTPGGAFATLTATNASASVALPAGVTIAFQNTGTTAVSCTVGVGSATATANQVIVQGSSTVFVVPGANTFGACIDQTGSASNLVVLAGGSGLGTGFGGGGSGGGGTTAVTVADGADVTQGAIADVAATAGSTGTVSAKLRLMTTELNTINTTLGSPFQAGGALAANQSVNVAQFGGVSTSTGQVAVSTAPVTATNTALVTALRPDSPGIVALGQTTKSASVPVAWASDQVGTAGTANASVVTVQGIASMTKLLVTPDSVALPANQSVNVAQVNGVTTLTGTGVAGTGTQRVTLSNTDPCMSPDIAKSSAPINITPATTTSLVAVSGSTVVYVCGFAVTINQEATTADTIAFEYGTGATCTSPTLLAGTFGAGGVTAATAPIVITVGHGGTTVFKSAASAGVCALTVGTAPSFQGVLTYVQQ